MQEPTSGTWTVEGELDGSAYSLHTSPLYQAAIYADNAVIADVRLSDYADKRTPEEARANALLIAAAPDLLAAAEQAITAMVRLGNMLNWPPEITESYADAINGLREARDNARGETP